MAMQTSYIRMERAHIVRECRRVSGQECEDEFTLTSSVKRCEVRCLDMRVSLVYSELGQCWKKRLTKGACEFHGDSSTARVQVLGRVVRAHLDGIPLTFCCSANKEGGLEMRVKIRPMGRSVKISAAGRMKMFHGYSNYYPGSICIFF